LYRHNNHIFRPYGAIIALAPVEGIVSSGAVSIDDSSVIPFVLEGTASSH
jgi:hypothetical protein